MNRKEKLTSYRTILTKMTVVRVENTPSSLAQIKMLRQWDVLSGYLPIFTLIRYANLNLTGIIFNRNCQILVYKGDIDNTGKRYMLRLHQK